VRLDIDRFIFFLPSKTLLTEEEKHLRMQSPQFVDQVTLPSSGRKKSFTLEFYVFNHQIPDTDNFVIDQESKTPGSTSDSPASTNPDLQKATENGSAHGLPKKMTVEDALCCLCNELLYLPSVLNCGHGECYMYCLFRACLTQR
jgi:hypothetical protein